MENCIADGIIFSSEIGSHGYWKSITRTIFRGVNNVGLGFISPTYGINNIVLTNTDKISIEMVRGATVIVSADKEYKTVDMKDKTVDMKVGDIINLEQLIDSVALFGYDIFCCYECRKNRNRINLNDMHFV